MVNISHITKPIGDIGGQSVTCGAGGQLALWNVGHALELVVTTVTEVDGAEAEEDGDWAAEATLVLEEVLAVLRTHLWREDRRRTAVTAVLSQ